MHGLCCKVPERDFPVSQLERESNLKRYRRRVSKPCVSLEQRMILIIDNYDSFTYNLVHLVERALAKYTVVRNDEITLQEIGLLNPAGIMISPGPGRPENAGITEDVIREFGVTTPILGVCLGHQAVGEVFGGVIVQAPILMHGKTSHVQHDGKTLFEGVEQGFSATRYHSLVVDLESLPDSLEVSAKTDEGVIMGFRHRDYPIEGIQFHPESLLSTEGPKIIANWVRSCTQIAQPT